MELKQIGINCLSERVSNKLGGGDSRSGLNHRGYHDKSDHLTGCSWPHFKVNINLSNHTDLLSFIVSVAGDFIFKK